MSLQVIAPHAIHITPTRADSLQQHLDEAVNKLTGIAATHRPGSS